MGIHSLSAFAEIKPIPRAGAGPLLKTSVNAYSFTKLLNAKIKHGGEGMDLYDVVDFCAKYNVDGFDATGYFSPGYPEKLPTNKYLNELKLNAFESGVGISGSGVRNNFTVADKAKRAADVAHIKQWVEVASQLDAPVLRVFADTRKNSTCGMRIHSGMLPNKCALKTSAAAGPRRCQPPHRLLVVRRRRWRRSRGWSRLARNCIPLHQLNARPIRIVEIHLALLIDPGSDLELFAVGLERWARLKNGD